MAGGFAVTINVRCEKGNVASKREMFIFQFNSNNKLCYCSSVSSAVPRVCAMAVIVLGFLQQKMPSQRGAGANSTGPSALHGPAGVGDEAALLLLLLLQSQLPPRASGYLRGSWWRHGLSPDQKRGKRTPKEFVFPIHSYAPGGKEPAVYAKERSSSEAADEQ